MKVVSWNVNSIRARKDRVLQWLHHHQPDVLCLQELKGIESTFPIEEVQALGYHAAIHGQPTYNGVAVLSRQPLEVRGKGLNDPDLDAHARLIHVALDELEVICVYVPNGSEVGSPKHAFKLQWLEAFEHYLSTQCDRTTKLAVCGDFNVAPEDRDVAKPEKWTGSVLTDPAVREILGRIVGWGLQDTFRLHHEDAGHYSWWDYRQLAFPKNNGLRIDFVFATEALAAECTEAWIDRDERKGKSPSDHVPVTATFTP